MSLIRSFSRPIRPDQSSFGLLTAIWWMLARSISCRLWPAATSTFFGVQPRFGHVAEIERFDHGDRQAGAPHGAGNTNAGVAAAEDDHVECL